MPGFRTFALTGTALALLAVSLVTPAQAQAPGAKATLVIHVQNVSPKGGILRLGLYDEAGYPRDGVTIASADVKAESPQTTITLSDIPPGTYAIQTFQDFNGNGQMDSSWIGLPQEPYGFSRDARPVLSRPGFDKTRFEVRDGMNVQTLRLQNSG
ncbi:MAG: DUF2141 domain-containing protein [Pseudomonadota bacterium]